MYFILIIAPLQLYCNGNNLNSMNILIVFSSLEIQNSSRSIFKLFDIENVTA